MKQKKNLNKQQGGISIVVALFIVAALFFWLINKPSTLTKGDTANSSNITCRPYDGPEKKIKVTVNGVQKEYKLIKPNALVDLVKYIDDQNHVKKLTDNFLLDGQVYSIYVVDSSEKVDFQTIEGNKINFDPNGFIFTTQLKKFINPDDGTPRYIVDYYMESTRQLPPDIYKCVDNPLQKQIVKATLVPELPTQSQTLNQKSLTMQYLTFKPPYVLANWFSFHCKPVIYLYPEQKEQVSVKLNPKGMLTETIPEYPKNGWVVTAYPDGTIESMGKTYPYLYYESKIRDEDTKIPQEGFVVAKADLKAFYNKYLPQLGLNLSETKEFADYWQKALPDASYYFIGFMDKESIDYIEPLTISPKPDTIIRVRFYFKPLTKPVVVQNPSIGNTKNRNGFTVVEWGGMVKTDFNHPFTCSQ